MTKTKTMSSCRSPTSAETVHFLKSVFILTISATLLQFIPPACGNGNYIDWDLAVAHGNRVKLISKGTNNSLDLTMQMPIGSLTATTQPEDSKNNNNRRVKQYLVSLAADPVRGLIFFSQTTNDLTSIAVFNLLDNVTFILYQKNSSVINGLAFRNGVLYWSDSGLNNIMQLNTTVFPGATPEVVLVSQNDSSIHGIAVNPASGVLYWGNWSTDSSSINMYDNTSQSNKVVISTNLYRPQGLFADESHLYWTDNPPGVYFTIERVLLSDWSQREILKRGENQHPFSLTAVCGTTLFWSDTMSRTLFQMNIKSKETSVVKQFRGVKPFGLVSNILRKCDPVVIEVGTGVVPDVRNITHIQNDSETKPSELSVLKDDVMEWCGDWESIPCQNGASCLSVNRKIFCLCTPGFTGPTCQDKYSKPPTESSPSSALMLSFGIGFLVVIVLLVIVIIFLGLKVRKLNKKPKIHKKIVVAKSRRRDHTTSSVCEMIDIENCCNMNVCETPCYDRIGPGSTSMDSKKEKKAAHKDEDKQRLIDT